MVKTRQRLLTWENVADILRNIWLKGSRTRTRCVIPGTWQRIGCIQSHIIPQATFCLKSHCMVDRRTIEPDGSNPRQRRNISTTADGTRPRKRHIMYRRIVGPKRIWPHIEHFDNGSRDNFSLDSTTPCLRVLNLIIMVHNRSADTTCRIRRQHCSRIKVRYKLSSWNIHLFHEEKRQVARK